MSRAHADSEHQLDTQLRQALDDYAKGQRGITAAEVFKGIRLRAAKRRQAISRSRSQQENDLPE